MLKMFCPHYMMESFWSSDAFIAVERTARGAQFIWPDAFAPARERNYGQATIYYANYQP
jgi:16S rRNA (guanine966-N2)-methyltransferase